MNGRIYLIIIYLLFYEIFCRKKLAMQIVPYIPIHPAQLNNDNISTTTITEEDELKNDNDDYIFKIPSVPTPYTVEEPCDNTIKRSSTMKR